MNGKAKQWGSIVRICKPPPTSVWLKQRLCNKCSPPPDWTLINSTLSLIVAVEPFCPDLHQHHLTWSLQWLHNAQGTQGAQVSTGWHHPAACSLHRAPCASGWKFGKLCPGLCAGPTQERKRRSVWISMKSKWWHHTLSITITWGWTSQVRMC